MKSLLKTTLVLGFALAPLIALAAPGIPHQFYGTVNFSNGPAPDGLTVEAKISTGAVVGVSTTKDGKYGYSPNLFFVTDANDGTPRDMTPGQEIRFFVNGIDTDATPPFSNGGYTEKNLGVSSAIGTISKSENDVITNGGGGGGSYIPPATSPLSAAAQKVDANKDGKIDVLDFNTLMVNWGKTTANNVADFNGDGKVDVFDFNLLMINWTL